MARPSAPKDRCNGQWTESKYVNFIKNALRSATRKWAPIQTTLKKAKVARGLYKCAGCGAEVPVTTLCPTTKKRVKNVFVDHTSPVVDPEVGFVDWNTFIDRLFCEENNLQLLCKACHDIKSKEERDIATQRRREEKQL